jgi:hypothetical protein
LEERLREHKKDNNKTCSKQIILRENYNIIKIDECDTEEESIELETRYIRNTDNCINRFIPGRTREEYYEENIDEIRKKDRERYEANKEEISEKRKETYTCECGSTLRKVFKSSHERTQTHIYFINNGKKKEIKVEQYTCECGSILTKYKKARHEKSLKHQNFINSK